ncbi:MAG TPA: hypothetical protein VFE15_02435 [Marmoricola sp.]|jgi:hypothetical protein|nr:hypothetical protein [Marmoricola sp.]
MSATGDSTYDEFVFTTGDELWDRLHQAHRRFSALLSVTPAATRLAGSEWTAGQVAAHLLTVLRRYTSGAVASGVGLSPDGAGVADLNSAELEELREMTVAEVLDQVWQELAELESQFPRSLDLHRPFPFHAGQQMDGAAALGNLISEFLLHGRDVALARRKIWKIGSRNAALSLNIGMQAAPGYVVPGAPDLKVEIRTPETNPWVLDLVGGRLTSRLAMKHEPVDVRVFGRTEPLLLNLYGRMPITTATLHGITVIGGRRPWRLTRLPSAFSNP